MSHSYYYLVSSLPLLLFGQRPPVSYDEFLADCQRIMTAQDYALMEAAVLRPRPAFQGRNAVLDQWIQFMNHCCNEIARTCALKARKDPIDYVRGDISFDPFVADLIHQAEKMHDPLAGEKLLDKAKWQKLDELAGGHHFDLEFLIVYSLKLQMAERYREIESERGKDILNGFEKESLAISQKA
ncbi:MAG: DUF2764 family protein [Candidatus Omnitrophota bacterium]